jgi:hypothetical protein
MGLGYIDLCKSQRVVSDNRTSARRPASVILTRATLIDLPQLFPEDCGFLF